MAPASVYSENNIPALDFIQQGHLTGALCWRLGEKLGRRLKTSIHSQPLFLNLSHVHTELILRISLGRVKTKLSKCHLSCFTSTFSYCTENKQEAVRFVCINGDL